MKITSLAALLWVSGFSRLISLVAYPNIGYLCRHEFREVVRSYTARCIDRQF